MPASLKHGDPQTFERYWALLNRPFVSEAGAQGLKTTVHGWYYDTQSPRWPGFAVFDGTGTALPFTLKRIASADLEAYFRSEQAAWHRFAMTFRWPDVSTIAALTFGHPELRLALDRERDLSTSVGTATLYVDVVTYDWNASVSQSLMRRLAASTRSLLAWLYSFAGPLLVLAGLVALIAACDGAIVARQIEPVLIVAAAAWLLVSLEVIGLALAGGTPVNLPTAAPAAYLAMLATFLSFGAVVVYARMLDQPSAGIKRAA